MSGREVRGTKQSHFPRTLVRTPGSKKILLYQEQFERSSANTEALALFLSQKEVSKYGEDGWVAWHSGSVRASHPAVPGSTAGKTNPNKVLR